ncbi:MAG: LysM peptidoglycan-binding domain-containing protein, partial [Oscillospiraceae bacterium]|nr:LysM peptidoglycan-binding domain-containing protein [Oscillospiraceae bacterium]
MQIYVVQQGDSLYSIAKRFGVSLHMLMETNGLPRPNDLIVGQSIVILTPEITHTVEQNETLEHISNQYNISLNQLYRNNPSLSARPQVIPGEEIVITYNDKPTKSIMVNGFTYPNVSHELLRNTMPFLTYVSPFTYSFTKDGELIPLRDESILRTAMEYNIRPLMSLSSITDEGIFDSDLSNTILNDQEIEQKLINEVIETMQSKNYSGIILDFEYILPENKNAYTN